MLRKTSPWVVLLLPWLALAAPARGEDELRVCVVAILATDRDTKIDAKLKLVAREVQKQEPTLTGFRLSTTNCKPMTVGTKESFCLVEGECLAVTLLQGFDKDQRVRLTVKAPTVAEVTYTTVCGKYFPLMTRYQTKDKERLIIAVMVRGPKCKEE